MIELYRCQHCGSVGSIEFDMCQVCLHDYSRAEGFWPSGFDSGGEEESVSSMLDDRGREGSREVVASGV